MRASWLTALPGLGVAAGALALQPACTSLAGLSTVDGGTVDTPDGSDGDTGLGIGGGDGGITPTGDSGVIADVPASCATEQVDDATTVFVSHGSSASAVTSCGTKTVPCNSITIGLDRARTSGKSLIVIDTGTYTEPLALAPDVTLQGGWDASSGTWKRQCNADRIGSVTLTAPGTVASAVGFTGTATLDTLTVIAGAPTDKTLSVYGVFASGPNVSIALKDAVVRAANAISGADGPPGDPAGPPGSVCAGGNGQNGPDGPAGTAAPAGAFGTKGFVAGDGAAGGTGTVGGNGTSLPGNCNSSCGSCLGSGSSCQIYNQHQVCGRDGIAGCGGGGGVGGAGGKGGGSSIALFAWDAHVTVDGGGLFAGNGGNGGRGGTGGLGAGGTPGSTAPSVSCTLFCSFGTPCVQNSQQLQSGAGGNGGAGGKGGAGAPGAGGSSFSLASGGKAMVTVSIKTLLGYGMPGTSPGGAPGAAGKRSP